MIRVTRSAVIDAPIERVWAVLRDFNSHTAWHPVVAESEIEGGEPSDQIGCVRRFTLRDGGRIREQLLALSDRDHVSTYCILDASVPLRRYVATLQLKRVTDGERTFWHWQSTFDAPPGRERELADMVGTGVYEGGFEGLRAYLRRGRPAPARVGASGRAVAAVSPLLPRDRVAYACAPPGAYVSARTMPADQVVVLPDDVDEETAAALMLKGMTAAYLLHRTHRVRAGETVLVHAAAGGVGLFLCQWARAHGAKVIGTVSSDEKARLARANGCELPLVGRDYRFAAAVRAATDGRGADVIYDGLGRAAMAENLEALALCGHWVSYGQASGPLAPIESEALGAKSVTLSRPVLFHYTAERTALNEIAQQTFEALRARILRVEVRHRYPLAAAAEAHRDLEGRRTTGPLLLLP